MSHQIKHGITDSCRYLQILKGVLNAAFIFINVDPHFGSLHCVEVGCVASVSEEHTASIIKAEMRLMMDAVCSSEMSATQPTSTWCKHPKEGSTLITS
jgi:hypothetical protein